MSQPQPDDARAEAAVWQAMVLFSTLSTATSVWNAHRERRAGHDPSAQEPAPFVRPYLKEAAGTLQAALMHLQASRLAAEDETSHLAALVRRFDMLVALRRATQQLKSIHQRLLSLYPEVPEELVEAARELYGESSDLLDADDDVFEAAAGPFVHRGLVFCGQLFDVVG